MLCLGPGSYHGDDRVVGDHGEVGDGDASYAGSDWCMVINMVVLLVVAVVMVMTMFVMVMMMVVVVTCDGDDGGEMSHKVCR